MLVLSEIQTPYVGDGDLGGVSQVHNLKRPKLGDNFACAWEDQSGAPVPIEPNIGTLIVEIEDTELQAVEDHPDYWVNWAETVEETPQTLIIGIPTSSEEPSQARHDAMTTWMLAQGYTQATVDATLGAAPAGRTALAISEEVYITQRTLPPGVQAPPFAFGVTAQRGPYYQGGLQGIRIRLDGLAQDVVPNAIAMARYSAPDASGTFLGTSGGCVWDETDQAWYSPGLLETDDSAPCYLAILYGSAIYLTFTLPGNVFEVSYIANGGAEVPGPGEAWVDSGATVTGVAGTVTLVSDGSPFSVGSLTRINGVEQEVTSLWPSEVSPSGLVLTPNQNPPHANGSIIEVWQ